LNPPRLRTIFKKQVIHYHQSGFQVNYTPGQFRVGRGYCFKFKKYGVRFMRELFLVPFLFLFAFQTACAQESTEGNPEKKGTVSFAGNLECGSDNVAEIFGREGVVPLNRFLFSDIRDLSAFYSEVLPEMKTLVQYMSAYSASFFPEGINYEILGPRYGSASQIKKVFGVEVFECPVKNQNENSVTLSLRALYSLSNKDFRFQHFKVTIKQEDLSISDIEIGSEKSLSEVAFQINISLVERKVTIMDGDGQIIKIYPVDVGGYDPAVVPSIEGKRHQLMTPIFEQPYLDRKFAQFARTNPDYFGGRPFIRVSHAAEEWSAIGLHKQMNGKLTRGFQSHGCIRVREKDLYELYYLVKLGLNDKIPMEMALYSGIVFDHPMPGNEADHYYAVSPYQKDGDGLTLMRKRKTEVPVALLGLTPQEVEASSVATQEKQETGTETL
jgi:hypothetical protein